MGPFVKNNMLGDPLSVEGDLFDRGGDDREMNDEHSSIIISLCKHYKAKINSHVCGSGTSHEYH